MKTEEEIIGKLIYSEAGDTFFKCMNGLSIPVEMAMKAMREFADQESAKAVEARDAEILEWITANWMSIAHSYGEGHNRALTDLKQFIQSKKK